MNPPFGAPAPSRAPPRERAAADAPPLCLRRCTAHMELVHGPLPKHAVILCPGNTAGFEITLRMMCDDDTIVITEEYTFSGFTSQVKTRGCPLYSAGMDAGGMVPSLFEEAILKARAENPGSDKVVLYIGAYASPRPVPRQPSRATSRRRSGESDHRVPRIELT